MKVFLDACVLFPPLVRSIVLGAAQAGLFEPSWSARVLEEWRRSIAAKQGLDAETAALADAARMRTRFPNAEASANPVLEAEIHLPDPGDAHVLAAAITGKADLLLTFNLRDFPRRTLAGHGLEARHPDGFLWELLGHHPVELNRIVDETLTASQIDQSRGRAVLKRARLSRFGKAWEGDRTPG